MKAFRLLLLVLITIGGFTSVHAQKYVNTDPASNKVLVDTTLLVAVETTFEPGKKTSLHTHSAFFAYVLKGGKLKVDYADGVTEEVDLKAGDYLFNGPDRPHRSVNIGTESMKVLIVELKEHPYVDPGKAKVKQRNR